MAWVRFTKKWDHQISELETARYKPRRYNVKAEIAEAARAAGVLADEEDDGEADGRG